MSAHVEAILSRAVPGTLLLSRWTEVEFASLLARNVRMGNMQVETATSVLNIFLQNGGNFFRVVVPTEDDFREATRLLSPRTDFETGLRGPDALHLAVAKNQGATFYNLDKPLLRAAQALGVPASDADIGAL